MGRNEGTCVVLKALIILLSAFSIARGDGGEASGRAVVRSDSLAVYARAATTGQVKKNLKKGDAVFVDAEITDSYGVFWCGIREEGDERITGFVQCKGLDRKEPEKGERWRALPYNEEPEEPEQMVPVSPLPKTPPRPSEPPKSPVQPGAPPAAPPEPVIIGPRSY